MDEDVIFRVESVLGVKVTLTKATWDDICHRKHRNMGGRLAEVQMAVSNPDEIRRSKSNDLACLYYRVQGSDRFIWVVTHATRPHGATVATAYTSTRVKPGELVWPT